MQHIDHEWVAAARDTIYRRTMARRVTTVAEAVQFVDEVGFAFLWPIKGIEAPNLFHAIAGQVRDVPMAHDDPDLSRCWSWKDQSLGGERWYYAKLLRRKATMVAPRLWGAFYALTHNYGDLEDYMERVLDGVMTHEARTIYETLLDGGAMDTITLRRTAGMGASSSKSRFERGLVELQIDMKALPVRVAEEGSWRYSFVYDIPMRHYPDLVDRARQFSTAEAWQVLIGAYIDGVAATSTKQVTRIFHVFEPMKRDVEKALDALAELDRIVPGELAPSPAKKGGRVWVSCRALEAG